MKYDFNLTGDINIDWDTVCNVWLATDYVRPSQVGATWAMPREHAACLQFAERNPLSKAFLIHKLSDSNPLLAAYAFKTLLRTCDLNPTDVPESVLQRTDEVDVQVYRRIERKTVGEYVREYFATHTPEMLQETDRLNADWQSGPLAEYEEAARKANRSAGPDS